MVIAGGTYWEGHADHWTKKLYSASTSAYNPASQYWTRLPDMPIPLGYPASTVVGNRLFVLGGYTGSTVNRKIFTLHKADGKYVWQDFGTITADRVFAPAVSVGSTIYLVGGTTAFEAMDEAGTCCTTRTATNTLLAFDTNHPARGWQRLASHPGKARWLSAVTTDGNAIWVMGGILQAEPKGPVTKFNEVLKYELATGKWQVMPPLPPDATEHQPLTALTIHGRILLFTTRKEVWQLDLGTQQYTRTTPLPLAAAVDRFFWLDQEIVGAGGEIQPPGPRRRSPWIFTGRITNLSTSP